MVSRRNGLFICALGSYVVSISDAAQSIRRDKNIRRLAERGTPPDVTNTLFYTLFSVSNIQLDPALQETAFRVTFYADEK